MDFSIYKFNQYFRDKHPHAKVSCASEGNIRVMTNHICWALGAAPVPMTVPPAAGMRRADT